MKFEPMKPAPPVTKSFKAILLKIVRDEKRANAGAARADGHSELRECRAGVPRPGILLAPDSETIFVARSRDSNVPASVHHPSRMLWVSVFSCKYMLFTSVISSSLRKLGLVLPIFSKTVVS